MLKDTELIIISILKQELKCQSLNHFIKQYKFELKFFETNDFRINSFVHSIDRMNKIDESNIENISQNYRETECRLLNAI